tara:strand:+ start:804 stop:1052 length:249 start_codon:yes stop_codon:yes gene_type:complete
MSNYQRYKKVFCDAFEIKEDILNKLEYQSITQWDSIGHMSMISLLEDEFDILMETDDIIDFSSFKVGIEILAKYKVPIDPND